MITLEITYRDGKTESKSVDDFSITNGCLKYYIRFGDRVETHYIPMDTIAKLNHRR